MSGTNKRSLGRIATGLAAAGALVMSSGAALLLVGASAADAAPVEKYLVCKFVGTPGVDETLQTGQNPISVPADALPDAALPVVFGASFADGQGRSFVLAVDSGQEVDSSACLPAEDPDPVLTTASVTFVDPTCENDNVASYTTSGENVSFPLTGTVAPGNTVTVTATADEGYVFADDQATIPFDHTFGAAETDCDVVIQPPLPDPDPDPVVDVAGPQVPDVTGTVTPTVVSSGILPTAGDHRGEQGLALLVAGMILMVIAGGLGVARPGGAVRN